MKQMFSKRISSVAAGLCALSVCASFAAFAQNKTDENAVRETVAESSVAQSENADVVVKTEKLPYIQYTFDNAENFLKNTGVSANDATKDYRLKINGNASASDLSSNGLAHFGENSSLYIPYEKNPFVDDLTDFTIAVDVKVERPTGWYGSVFSWDSFSSYDNLGNSSKKGIDNYHRINTSYVGQTADWWLRLGDRNWKANDGQRLQYNSWAGGKEIYSITPRTDNTGELTLVYSLSVGKILRVTAYQNGTAVGTSIAQDISDWSLYTANSTYKTFMIGGCYDTRFIVSMADNNFTQAQKYKGTMDNIRIYDFAMSDEQMAEYAATKKISVAGVRVEETENGSVNVSNTIPSVGEEVIITPVPDTEYEVDAVYVNGEAIQAENGVYKAVMQENGLSVRVTFKETAIKKLKVVSMSYGGSIRCGGETANSGLRFRIEAAEADYEAALSSVKAGASAEYGILIIPEDYQGKYGAFTAENLFGESAKYHLAEKNEDGSLKEYEGGLPQIINFWTNKLYLNETTGNYEYYGSITGIKTENLTRKFVGVGVVKYTEGAVTQYAVLDFAGGDIVNNTRSIYQVAKLAELDEKLPAAAKAWIKQNYIDLVETTAVQGKLNGKKLSILGDSISTYQGVSNNAEINSTIGNNEVFYGTQNTTVAESDTWWKQAADNTGMSVLVNNSWAGANVATNFGNATKGGCTARAENLHNNGGENPDIIAVYMGINDNGCLTGLGSFNDVSDIWNGTAYVGNTELFATAYATMVHKIVTKYSAADVFLFTLPRNNYLWLGTKAQYNALQDEYNKMIYKIAGVFGCKVVDLATAVGEDCSDYLLTDNIHPDAKGMDIITAAFETALYSYYSEN